MLARERHGLPVKEPSQDLAGLGHASLASRGCVERHADRFVFGERVAGTEAQLNSATGELVKRRDLTGKVYGVMEVVVDDQGA